MQTAYDTIFLKVLMLLLFLNFTAKIMQNECNTKRTTSFFYVYNAQMNKFIRTVSFEHKKGC